jgi:hypothetical protein
MIFTFSPPNTALEPTPLALSVPCRGSSVSQFLVVRLEKEHVYAGQ